MSPSARKVWIEIFPSFSSSSSSLLSPSARKVWIEMFKHGDIPEGSYSRLPQGRCGLKYFYSQRIGYVPSRLPQGRCGLKCNA